MYGYGVHGWDLGEFPQCDSRAVLQRFTAKERDEESGLDYFGARYMASALGRFTSADAPFADQHAANPQSWNLYGYVRNNPLLFIDPTGRTTRVSLDGTVLDVTLDDDTSVIVHEEDGLEYYIGETEYVDEFAAFNNDTGELTGGAVPGARILVGTTWDGAINSLAAMASGMSLSEVIDESGGGGGFDIKEDDADAAPHGPGTGRLLNGKYATARSAGNFLFGRNMRGRVPNDFALGGAGGYHTSGNSKVGAAIGAGLGMISAGAAYPKEIPQANRRIRQGLGMPFK